MSDQTALLSVPAIRVVQPLGEFYVVALSARLVRKITFIDPTRVASADRKRFFYNLLGAQRQSSRPRAKQIAHYIDTIEAAFPNSIILAANYINNGVLQEDPTVRWRVEKNGARCYDFVIPTDKPMASVIDGQHRLLGFDFCRDERRDMELVCAIYMDLPHAYQAYLFATININQRKVDKSLAYEQFGYNLDEEANKGWSPDKLAVFLTRKLNLDPDSPFHGHIKIAPVQQEELLPGTEGEWKVSTAAIVEGIIRLVSSAPATDRDTLHKQSVLLRSREALPDDTSPFRDAYRSALDEEIYSLLKNYFSEASSKLWAKASDRSYVRKTIGVQALFDILRYIGQDTDMAAIPGRAGKIFENSSVVDFSDGVYQASGKGRVLVKNTILLYSDLVKLTDLPEGDRELYAELLMKYPRTTHN